MTPKITVVIAAFNAESTLKDTLDSVKAQTFQELEIIVVNDGSTDQTTTILESYSKEYDSLRIVSQKNMGVSRARMNGIYASRGEWVAFLDADDLWMPDKLELQVAELERHSDAVLVFADQIDVIGEREDSRTNFQQKPPARGRVLAQLFFGNFISTSSVIVKRSAIVDIGGFNPKLRVNEDTDLWLRLSEVGEFCYVDKVLVRRRILSTSLTRSRQLECYKQDLEIIEFWLKRRPDMFKVTDKLVSRRIGSIWKRMADFQFSAGSFSESHASYLRAIAFLGSSPQLLFRVLLARVPYLANGAQRFVRFARRII